jgi:hypothetical protein
MLWLNPVALFALASVALPILIHLLIQRRAARFQFPTLRFLQPTRLAAIRRHLLEDLPLLAVRVALFAAAAAALAGPLLVTAARRQAWDRRVVRALVTDRGATDPAARVFETTRLPDGIRRAIFWLDTTPPARREIVIASAFPIGSITPADVAAIPADIGVRFERIGTLPAARTVAAGRLLTSGGMRAREVTLTGDRTSVHDADAGGAAVWPIDVVSAPADRPAVDAAIAVVLSQRVWAGPSDRRARLVLVRPADANLKVGTTSEVGRASSTPEVAQAFSTAAEVVQAFRPAVIEQPWMADALARIVADRDLRDAASRVAAGLTDQRFTAAPWQILTSAADGRPLAVAAGSPDRLLVAARRAHVRRRHAAAAAGDRQLIASRISERRWCHRRWCCGSGRAPRRRCPRRGSRPSTGRRRWRPPRCC